MIKYYTAVGQFDVIRKSNSMRYPIIRANDKEHVLSFGEALLWTKAKWDICTPQTLREKFINEEFAEPDNFDFILNRLIQRDLMACGEAEDDTDALIGMVCNLIVQPRNIRLRAKILNFLSLVVFRGVPMYKAREVFVTYKLSEYEKTVCDIAGGCNLTAGSLLELLNMEQASALSLILNMYLKRLIVFSDWSKDI